MEPQNDRNNSLIQHQQLLSRLDLFLESERLLTFQNWPYMACLVRSEDLARSGFYYLGVLDRVKCFSCNVLLSNWSFGSIVDEYHRTRLPQCRMVRGVESRNIPIISTRNHYNSSPNNRSTQLFGQNQTDPTNRSIVSQASSSSLITQAPDENRVVSNPLLPRNSVNASNENSFLLQGSEIQTAYVGDHYHYHDHHTTIVQSGAESINLDEEMISELQTKLKCQARLASEDIKLPLNIQRSITPVTLEITTNFMQAFENPDDTGHGHRREDFLSAVVRPEGDVVLEELFSQAWRRAEQEFSYMGGEIKENNIRIYGNIVGVIGQAGIGKTTLTKMFTKRILDEAILTADYLFYIPLRNVDFLNKNSLIRFLVSSSSCDWHHGETCDNGLLEKLKQNSNVVIIFDGLDEARMDLMQPPTAYSSLDKTESFIKSILTGRLLSHAKKLVTSRPRQFYDMLAEYRPRFVVAITGLSRVAQTDLCRELCGDDHTRVIQYLEEHHKIFDYCYVPVNCILTMHCVNQSFEEEGDINLNSITGILAYALDKFLRSPIIRESGGSVESGQFEPEKLCHLAWNGFAQKKIIFGESELIEVNIHDDMLNAFLQTSVDSDLKFRILEKDKQSYFSHLIWQEFFTAIELMFFMRFQDFCSEMCNFNSSRWENVTKFMFGMCNPATFSRLKRLFRVSVQQEEKRVALKDFAFACMPAVHENDSTPALLQVCDWIAEAQIETFTRKIVDAIPEVIKMKGSIHSGDISNLFYVLRATQKPHFIHVGFGLIHSIKFTGNCFLKFFEDMEITLQQKSNLKLTSIKIFNSHICSSGMQHMCRCLHNIEELGFFQFRLSPFQLEVLAQGMQDCNASLKEFHVGVDDENERGCRALAACILRTQKLELRFSTISSEGYRILSEAIQAREQSLNHFMFRGNLIADEAIAAISGCLNKVDSLTMEGNEFSENGVRNITDGIQIREQTMGLLKLNRSRIGNEGGIAISSCLEKIQNLLLMYCGINSVGVTAMSETLQTLQRHQLHTLDLSANAIDDTGATPLSFGLQSIKNLILINCNITWRGVQKLSEAIASLETPMEELNISFNKIGDEGIEAMLGCLSNIGHLNISGCGVRQVGLNNLSNAISLLQHNNTMKLTLDMNEIGDEGAYAISVLLNNIQYLSIKRCGITAAGISLISDSILLLSIPVEELDISENKIGVTGFEAISTCLRNIKSLFIISCDMTAVDAQCLSNALNQLPQPMKKLSLNINDIGADGGIALSTCLQKVQTLDITQCNITGVGVMAMSKAIKAMNDGSDRSVVGLYAQ